MGFGAGEEAGEATIEAAKIATEAQMAMFEQTKELLKPYVQMGYGAGNELMSRLPGLTEDIKLDQNWLESTPGYQFARDQGLKATQSGFAARGLGNSGAALKGAGDFATGLANNTYAQRFAETMNQRGQQFNMLMGTTQIGAGAAAGQAQVGTGVANNIASNTMAAGNAKAQGIMQDANMMNGLLGQGIGLLGMFL